MNYSRELRYKNELQKEFEKTLASQLDSFVSRSIEFDFIVESGYDKIKFKKEYIKLIKTIKVFLF